jgi:hypothetical protein
MTTLKVLFWSAAQGKPIPITNQSPFKNFNWENFEKGDVVYSANGNLIGVVKLITSQKVWITDQH